jgi:hypothetical protein
VVGVKRLMGVHKFSTKDIELDTTNEIIRKGLKRSPSFTRGTKDFLSGILELSNFSAVFDGLNQRVIDKLIRMNPQGKTITLKTEYGDPSTITVHGSAVITNVEGSRDLSVRTSILETDKLEMDLPKIAVSRDVFFNATDVGLRIAIPFGKPYHVPLRYIHYDESDLRSTHHHYSVYIDDSNITTKPASSVSLKRNEVSVDNLEYIFSSSTFSVEGAKLGSVMFRREQKDFNGNLFNLAIQDGISVIHPETYNLISNSDLGGLPASWLKGANISTVFFSGGVDTTPDGGGASKWSGGNGDINTSANFFSSYPLTWTSGKNYWISFYAKRESGTGRLKTRVTNQSFGLDLITDIDNKEYKRFAVSFAATSTVFERLAFLSGDGTSEFSLDKVQVTQSNSPLPYVATTVFIKPSDTSARSPLLHLKRILENKIWGMGVKVNTDSFLEASLKREPFWIYSDGTLADTVKAKDAIDELSFIGGVYLDVNEDKEWSFIADVPQEVSKGVFIDSEDWTEDLGQGFFPLKAVLERRTTDLKDIPQEIEMLFVFDEFLGDYRDSRKKTVFSGGFGTHIRSFNFLKDELSVDRILHYWSEWIKAIQVKYVVNLGYLGQELSIGNIIEIVSSRWGMSGTYYIRQISLQNEETIAEVLKYNDKIYRYDANTYDSRPDFRSFGVAPYNSRSIEEVAVVSSASPAGSITLEDSPTTTVMSLSLYNEKGFPVEIEFSTLIFDTANFRATIGIFRGTTTSDPLLGEWSVAGVDPHFFNTMTAILRDPLPGFGTVTYSALVTFDIGAPTANNRFIRAKILNRGL